MRQGAILNPHDECWRSWFCQEVLPLEPKLTRFLSRNWRAQAEINDLRQEIYARILSSAETQSQPPSNTQAFVFAIARNYLIDLARRASVVRIELVADLGFAMAPTEDRTPEQVVSARHELARLKAGLDRLPKRCKQVITLRRIEGLSQKETAARLGISVKAVEQHTTNGMRALVDFVFGQDLADRPFFVRERKNRRVFR